MITYFYFCLKNLLTSLIAIFFLLRVYFFYDLSLFFRIISHFCSISHLAHLSLPVHSARFPLLFLFSFIALFVFHSSFTITLVRFPFPLLFHQTYPIYRLHHLVFDFHNLSGSLAQPLGVTFPNLPCLTSPTCRVSLPQPVVFSLPCGPLR